MEVRCQGCNKLFRVSDDKITGTGVKFSCTRCGASVKITREAFESYKMQQPAPVQAAPRPVAAPPVKERKPAAAPAFEFDLSDPATAAAALSVQEEAPVLQPENPAPFVPRPSAAEPRKDQAGLAGVMDASPNPASAPKTDAAPKPKPKPEPLRAPVIPAAAAAADHEAPHPAHPIPTPVSMRPERSGTGKKILVLAMALLIIGAAAYGVFFYIQNRSQQAMDVATAVTPEGLQIQSAAGAIDTETNDLVITGVVENKTEMPKPGWYVVADVYDAQNNVLVRAKLLNGKQVYTKRDYEILAGRGINIEELKANQLQQQGIIIPALGSVMFEIRVMDPPVGIASFNATLQPFDPEQLFREIAEEQK
jgi:predicted Zn finger-like uncharacterized protein